MPRFKTVPVHVSSPVRVVGKMSQASRSMQTAKKREGSALAGRGSKRARVLRPEPVADRQRGSLQEEVVEEEEELTSSEGTSDASSNSEGEKSDSEAGNTESEQTNNEDSGGGSQNGSGHEQTMEESFEQEPESVRVDPSKAEAHSPPVRESAEGSERTEVPQNSAPSPRSVRRRRAQKHARAAAVRKAPATKNNQRGALRAFEVSTNCTKLGSVIGVLIS